MSEETQEIREAAAVGAAAAVDAIVGEQQEEQRAEAVEESAALAAGAAIEAGEQADMAAEVATGASAVASEAHAEATEAEQAAEQAAELATDARSGVEALAEHMTAGFAEMRKFITESLAPKPPDTQPTEVVVSHGDSGQSTGEGSDTGSSGSARPDDRPYRHRFGRR